MATANFCMPEFGIAEAGSQHRPVATTAHCPQDQHQHGALSKMGQTRPSLAKVKGIYGGSSACPDQAPVRITKAIFLKFIHLTLAWQWEEAAVTVPVAVNLKYLRNVLGRGQSSGDPPTKRRSRFCFYDPDLPTRKAAPCAGGGLVGASAFPRRCSIACEEERLCFSGSRCLITSPLSFRIKHIPGSPPWEG